MHHQSREIMVNYFQMLTYM